MIPTDSSTAMCERRPAFESPKHWLEHYNEAVTAGRVPWPPETQGEFLLADEHGLLDTHPYWIPCKVGLRMLGLREGFGRTLTAMSERWRERVIITMVEDSEFCSAVATCLRGVE